MQLIRALIIVCALFSGFECYARERGHAATPPEVSIKQTGAEAYTLHGVLRSGKLFNEVRYFRRAIGNDWVLEVRPTLGMQVKDAHGRLSSSPTLTTDEFLELMDLLFREIGENGMKPSYIHMDLGLVDAYEQLTETAIRHAKCRGGTVRTGDPCWSQALRNQLESSDTTKRVCILVTTHNAKCRKRAIDIDPVVLSANFNGQPRDRVAAQRHAGLRISAMWFALAIEQVR
jgi:hypothetical protein